MLRPATVIVLASPAPDSGTAALEDTLHAVLESGLPALVVTPPEMASAARSILPANDVLTMNVEGQEPATNWLARAIRAGVEASPQAGGWLLVPLSGAPVPAGSLHEMATHLPSFPLVQPAFDHGGSGPIGVSGELFSELMQLGTARDLQKLASRYPTVNVRLPSPPSGNGPAPRPGA